MVPGVLRVGGCRPGSRVGGGADDTSHFTFSEPLTMGMGACSPSYVEWCKSAGFFALSRNRFLQELRRAAPRVWGGRYMRRANLEKTQGSACSGSLAERVRG